MTARYGVGLGSSGPLARRFVEEGLGAMKAHPALEVRAESRLYLTPAAGGATLAPFVNAAALIDSPLAPAALLLALRALERRAGRVRARRYGGRSLDLDLLWYSGPPLARVDLCVPHPRLLERPFALVPLLECLRRAGLPPPVALLRPRAHPRLAPLPG